MPSFLNSAVQCSSCMREAGAERPYELSVQFILKTHLEGLAAYKLQGIEASL